MRKLLRALACLVLFLPLPAIAAERFSDETPRVAVISAFAPELTMLLQATSDARSYELAGVRFTTGTLSGRPVVLFLSGVSMVNSAMTTQMALDHFNVTAIVFSGIAGGVDPDLAIGDVVIPEQWSQYLETLFAREAVDGSWSIIDGKAGDYANFGMMFPRPVRVARPGGEIETRFWFQVDPDMLAAARTMTDAVTLARCAADACLARQPRVVVGGNGVSGQSFVDNAAFRTYVFDSFRARVLDMESAAVGHVAYANGVPFLVIRSLSDLAGGGPGENEIGTFFQLAADNSATVVERFLTVWTPPE